MIKSYFETRLGVYHKERAQSEVKAQEAYEMRLREQARATIFRLRAQGKRVIVTYSNNFVVGNRGLTVMPVPRLTEFGQLAWTVR